MDSKRKIGCILSVVSSIISIILAIVFTVFMVDTFIPEYAQRLILENPTFLINGAWRDVVFVIEVYTFGLVALVIIFNIVTIVFTALHYTKGKSKSVAGVLNILVISPLNIASGILILKSDN